MRPGMRVCAGAMTLALGFAAAAIAQTPANEILVSEQRAATGVTILGEVVAEVHQKTVFSKTSPRTLLDQELRAKAAKLGADAVIGVTYDFNSAVLSSKGNHAKGTAVRMNPGALAAASPAPAPGPSPVSQPKSAPTPEVEPVPSSAATHAPSPAARPVASPPVAAAAAVPSPASTLLTDGVLLSESDLPDRRYKVLGAITSEIHIKTIRSKQKPRDLLDADLRAKAKAMGADAVIQIRYDFNGAMLSSKGNHASGVAVKFDR